MAASMIRCRVCQESRKIFNTTIRTATSNSYYVLLPEVPSDTADSNAVMKIHGQPEYNKISPEKIIKGCAKLSINFEVELAKHVENLKDPNYPKTFQTVFDPIEEGIVPLNNAWRIAKNLSYVVNTEGYRIAFQRIHPQVEKAKNERWINESLYNAIKEVKADHRNLNEFQERLVDMYLLEGKLNGIELYGKDKGKFLAFLKKIAELKNTFKNRMFLTHKLFSHVIDDFDTVVDLPRDLIAQIAVDKSNPSRGPWKVTLNNSVYEPFMEHCSERMLRWNVWQAYNQRSSVIHSERNLSNHQVIKDIRDTRKDLANCLGYDNFAEMSMETKMAGSVENVLNMIESLKREFKDRSFEEVDELQTFAQSEGFQHELQMWDVPFWQRKQKEHLYGCDEAVLSQYFPLSRVLSGLFNLCSDLFGINITDHTGEVEVWEQNVRFYVVTDRDSGEQLATFYLDPYSRPGTKMIGGWMEGGRERSDLLKTEPISYLNLNFHPPVAGRDPLLTTRDLQTLFHEFGHGLQQLLTTVPHSEIAGQRNIEWDALMMVPFLMTRLLFSQPILTQLSYHVDTGEPIPQQLAANVIAARKHMKAYSLMRELYISALDMDMYVSDDHWLSITKKQWNEFNPIPLHEDDSHPCSLYYIFADPYPAAYFTFTWAEMLAADAFSAFEEAGLKDMSNLAPVGKRFRETVLSLGGGVSAGEAFRRFRGRDPTQDALVREYQSKTQ